MWPSLTTTRYCSSHSPISEIQHVGEVQGSPLQPSVEITSKRSSSNLAMQAQTYFLLVRAHGPSRFNTLFGKKRRFYAVANRSIAKITTAIRSVEQAVEGNKKLDAL